MIPSKKHTAEYDDWLAQQERRGDKTAIELFFTSIRALALQSRVTGLVRSHLRFSPGTGGN